MPSAGILIILAVLFTLGCVKARAAGPAAIASAFLVLFVVATPLGSWVPNGMSSLFAVIDGVTTPVLNHDSGGGAPVAVNSSSRSGAKTVGADR
jgi:hypothetical protein